MTQDTKQTLVQAADSLVGLFTSADLDHPSPYMDAQEKRVLAVQKVHGIVQKLRAAEEGLIADVLRLFPDYREAWNAIDPKQRDARSFLVTTVLHDFNDAREGADHVRNEYTVALNQLYLAGCNHETLELRVAALIAQRDRLKGELETANTTITELNATIAEAATRLLKSQPEAALPPGGTPERKQMAQDELIGQQEVWSRNNQLAELETITNYLDNMPHLAKDQTPIQKIGQLYSEAMTFAVLSDLLQESEYGRLHPNLSAEGQLKLALGDASWAARHQTLYEDCQHERGNLQATLDRLREMFASAGYGNPSLEAMLEDLLQELAKKDAADLAEPATASPLETNPLAVEVRGTPDLYHDSLTQRTTGRWQLRFYTPSRDVVNDRNAFIDFYQGWQPIGVFGNSILLTRFHP